MGFDFCQKYENKILCKNSTMTIVNYFKICHISYSAIIDNNNAVVFSPRLYY